MPADGGKYRRETLDLEFRRLPQSRVEKIMAAEVELHHAVRTGADNVPELMAIVRAHAAEVVCGWRGMLESDGGPEVPFSETSLQVFLDLPGVAQIILSVYSDSLPKAKEKNSRAPRTSGS
jgi:hypothetical protein